MSTIPSEVSHQPQPQNPIWPPSYILLKCFKVQNSEMLVLLVAVSLATEGKIKANPVVSVFAWNHKHLVCSSIPSDCCMMCCFLKSFIWSNELNSADFVKSWAWFEKLKKWGRYNLIRRIWAVTNSKDKEIKSSDSFLFPTKWSRHSETTFLYLPIHIFFWLSELFNCNK